MNKNMSAHLNEETFIRWQMGDATESERNHIEECTECRAKAKTLKDALSWFGAAARQWGEERAALVQSDHDARDAAVLEWRKSHASAARGLRTIAAAWALAGVALLLLFAIGVPRWKAHQAAIEAQQRQQEQKQDLARDNALLEAVDQDVSQEVPVAMQPLSWNTASSTSASSTGGLTSRQ